MTESEAIKEVKRHIQFLRENWKPHPDYNVIEALGEAIQALEEVEQYRAIGTVEDVAFYKKCYEEESYEYCGEYGTDTCACKNRMEYLEKKISDYEAIGTTERFRELTEKAEPQKPLNIRPNATLFDCPSCGRTQKILYQGFHCKECGQRLDWE